MIALLQGCALSPLSDVPITGGTPEVRDALREGMEAFDSAIGPGRLEIARVVVKPLELSEWTPGTHVVKIADDLDPLQAVDALNHELCHALDSAEGPFWAEDAALWERLAGELFAGEDERWKTQRERRKETFAVMCSRGPWLAATLAGSTCDGEDPDGPDVTGDLSREVWLGQADIASAMIGDPEAWFEAWTPVTWAVASGTGTQGVIELTWTYPDGESGSIGTGVFADRRTGEIVTEPVFVSQGSPEPPPGPTAQHTTLWELEGADGGPLRARAQLDLGFLGDYAREVMYVDDAWWKVGDGCVDPVAAPFLSDGDLLDLNVDGSTISWSVVRPE